MARPPTIPKFDAEERLLTQIAWAYYFEGLTQENIANKLKITRLRVNKAIAHAQSIGLVRVSLNTDFSACPDLELQLCETFGLKQAYVAPAPDRADYQQMMVGAALGQILSSLLMEPKVKKFGLTWGNTLNVATRFMSAIQRPELELISVMGGLTRGAEFNGFEITARLAHLIGSQHSYFPAPLYADSKRSRDIIMQLDVFEDVLKKIRNIDGLAIACGDMSSRSLLVRDGLPADVKAVDLVKRGAVGDVLGTVIDKNGNPIDHPINERVVGMGLADVRRIPNTILAAGGLHKVGVIRAMLKQGLAKIFVTDEATAKGVLEAIYGR